MSAPAATGIPLETFPALASLASVRHGFAGRIPGLDVTVERSIALARLDEFHVQARRDLGLAGHVFITADQVHGNNVTVVTADTPVPVLQTDGLITADLRVCLGVYTADCGPVFIVDPVKRVIALLHSGRKGTDLGIATVAIEKMQREFGSDPAAMIAQLGPCIRPPHYEVDFAATIARQCRDAGLREVHDCNTCTGANVGRYYSYRVEKGRTGRLLALLALL